MPDDWLALVLEHRLWAIRIASRRARRLPGMDSDDAASEAMIALIGLSRRYDPASGIRFQAFALRRIIGAVTDLHRLSDPAGRHERRQEAAGLLTKASRQGRVPRQIQGDVETLLSENEIHTNGGPPSYEASQEMSAELRLVLDAIASLPPRIGYVARRHWIDGEALLTVALELGVSESRVCQLVKMAREELRADGRF